jgi:hypothetical protein
MLDALAKVAYEGHREALGRQNCVPWEELTSASHEAWRAAVRALVRTKAPIELPAAPLCWCGHAEAAHKTGVCSFEMCGCDDYRAG